MRQRRADRRARRARADRRQRARRQHSALRILDHQIIARAIDHHAVMQILEDHIVGRRRDIGGRLDVDRHGNIDRHGQNIGVVDHIGRRQHDEIRRRRRQEIVGRRGRRRKAVRRIVEVEFRPVDIDHFFGRRRRIAHVDRLESRRRLQRASAHGEQTPCVRDMRPARIAAQIGPVGIGRVQHARAAPNQRLAPRRENGAHALGQRIAGIGGEIFLITLERIALDAGGVSVSRPKPRDRLRAQCGVVTGARRRLRRAIEKHEGTIDRRRIPWDLRALRHFRDAQPGFVENLHQRHSAGADRLGQPMRIGAVGAGPRRGDRARRGVIGEQQIGAGFEQRKPAGDRLVRQRERIFARRVEDDNGGFQGERRQGFQIVRQARGA